MNRSLLDKKQKIEIQRSKTNRQNQIEENEYRQIKGEIGIINNREMWDAGFLNSCWTGNQLGIEGYPD